MIIPFVIIDNTTGEVLQDLSHWVVSPQTSLAFHNVKFEAICSCSGRYTIIIGPDENNYSMKTTKLLTRKQPFTLRLNVSMTYFMELLYDKVNRTCITFNVSFLNAYIMIPSHTGSALSTHTTLFGWVILITMMSLDPRLRSCL